MAIIQKFNSNPEAAFNKISQSHDSTFRIHYFPIHGVAYTSRLILAASGAKWESSAPTNWAEEKATTPFGVLPVLYETITTKEGVQETIEIPESEAIERYLSKKFGLLGETPFQEVRIDAYVSSIKTLLVLAFARIPTVKDAAHKQELVGDLIAKTIPAWVKNHEAILNANGNNGHYVGNKLSLADLRGLLAIRLVLSLTQNNLISQEATPGLFNLWEKVNNIPTLKSWKETDSYNQLDQGYNKFIEALVPPKEA